MTGLFGGGLITAWDFINGLLGDIFTRRSAKVIAVYIVVTFLLAYQNWFITTKWFTSEQIFLFGLALYFLLKVNAYGAWAAMTASHAIDCEDFVS